MMKKLKLVIAGIIIGAGMILPGVSGGVLAIIFGIYENMIHALTNFFADWKKHISYLMPIFIGVIIGIILFGKMLNYFFYEYHAELCFIFMGLILGSLPVLFLKMKERDAKGLNVVVFLISFLVSMCIFVLGKNIININIAAKLDGGIIANILLILTGFIYISGKIIPGISSSFMLMLIGMYQYFLHIIANVFTLTKQEMIELIPVLLGVIMGAVVMVKLIKYLLDNHYRTTYSFILGFVLGSIAAIYPGLSYTFKDILNIMALIISFLISYRFLSQTNIDNDA